MSDTENKEPKPAAPDGPRMIEAFRVCCGALDSLDDPNAAGRVLRAVAIVLGLDEEDEI